MRILVLANSDTASPGYVGRCITRRGGEMAQINPHNGGGLPAEPDGFDGLVILGGAQHAGDDQSHPALAPMRRLMGAFHDNAVPVLGLCLGAQLLAQVFGQPVYTSETFEFGFHPLTLTRKAETDPLLAGLAREQWVFQWHEDTFDLPQGAQLLMEGTSCPNQAFRMGPATYGFQCHFEVTEEIIRHWLAESPQSLARRHGGNLPQVLARLDRQIGRHLDGARALADTVTGRWLDLIPG